MLGGAEDEREPYAAYGKRSADEPTTQLGRFQQPLRDLEETGGAHAAADAHGADDVADAAALALDEGVADHPRAAHAVGVADRDGAAVDVEPLHRDAEPVATVDHLHRERLVELPEADVV